MGFTEALICFSTLRESTYSIGLQRAMAISVQVPSSRGLRAVVAALHHHLRHAPTTSIATKVASVCEASRTFNKRTHRNFRSPREGSANAIISLAGVHVVAALFHHFMLCDGVLLSMLRTTFFDRVNGQQRQLLPRGQHPSLQGEPVIKIVLRPVLDLVGRLVEQAVDGACEVSAALVGVAVEGNGPVYAVAAREQKC
jgi:hypothetical protein